MQRKQESGAKKRKKAEDKKARTSAALENVPRIDQLFRPVPSTSSLTSTSNDVICETTGYADCEINLAGSAVESYNAKTDQHVDFDMDIADVSAEKGDKRSEITQFPIDVALWNIESDIISLQKYWIEKGI